MGIIKIKNPKIILKTIIFDSGLKESQKETWYTFINSIIDQDALSILKTIQEDKTVLEFLTENLEQKIEILKTGDMNNWKKVIKKEKEFIELK